MIIFTCSEKDPDVDIISYSSPLINMNESLYFPSSQLFPYVDWLSQLYLDSYWTCMIKHRKYPLFHNFLFPDYLIIPMTIPIQVTRTINAKARTLPTSPLPFLSLKASHHRRLHSLNTRRSGSASAEQPFLSLLMFAFLQRRRTIVPPRHRSDMTTHTFHRRNDCIPTLTKYVSLGDIWKLRNAWMFNY